MNTCRCEESWKQILQISGHSSILLDLETILKQIWFHLCFKKLAISCLGGFLGRLGGFLGRLGSVFGRLEAFWAVLEASWAFLAASEDALGGLWGRPGGQELWL